MHTAGAGMRKAVKLSSDDQGVKRTVLEGKGTNGLGTLRQWTVIVNAIPNKIKYYFLLHLNVNTDAKVQQLIELAKNAFLSTGQGYRHSPDTRERGRT